MIAREGFNVFKKSKGHRNGKDQKAVKFTECTGMDCVSHHVRSECHKLNLDKIPGEYGVA